ncbi:MAG: c-type cytochrome [Deltaproteobacteria bacterium]|nr:c-type cytochrome [Deltaproteobacteria bacterium]
MIATLALFALAASPAEERFLATEVIDVVRVPGPLVAKPEAAGLYLPPATRMWLAPQRTVRLPDRDANEALDVLGAPRALEVRAFRDDNDLALVLEWRDETEDRGSSAETDRFGDAAAVELPLAFGPGVRLPYVGMGDDGAPVALYLQRAVEHGTLGRELVAAGFGSSTRTAASSVRAAMRYDAAKRSWRAMLVIPLVTPERDLRAGLVPIGFALWDGAHRERGGNKALSSWKVLRMPGQRVDDRYLTELAWGFDGKGDVLRGKQLIDTVCGACHRAGDKRSAPVGLAPPLDDMGLVATPSYLRDSVMAPSAVVVPGKGWSVRAADGTRTSVMPPFAALPAADLDAIVAYLRTLGVPAVTSKAEGTTP